MRRATTPTHTFIFPEKIQVTSVTEALLTYSQCGVNKLEKKLSDLSINAETNSFSIKLSQEETTKFAPGKALIQVRIKIGDATLASQMIWLPVKPVLDSEVM